MVFKLTREQILSYEGVLVREKLRELGYSYSPALKGYLIKDSDLAELNRVIEEFRSQQIDLTDELSK